MTIHYRQTYPARRVADFTPASLRYLRQRGVYRDGVKRGLDLLGVAVLALPALAILALVMPLIALDGHSPIYRQERIGRGGRIFRLWKLRSMVWDADARLEAHLAANPRARAEWNHHQKLRDDPRITWIGRFIRRASIDELPQLLNVLSGDMSLVGPRPMMPSQRDIYPGHAYYELRPGITGAWQVSERHESSFSERAWHDTGYYRDLSLGTDLAILLRTVGVVLRSTGA